MSIEAILIGGPKDGERFTLPSRWSVIEFAMAPSWSFTDLQDLDKPPMFKTHIYRCGDHDGPGTPTDYIYQGIR